MQGKSFFMSTIYYTLSRRKNALGQSEILMRFSHGKLNQRAKTGLFVNPKYWHAGAIRLPNLRLLPGPEIQSEIDTATETRRRHHGPRHALIQRTGARGDPAALAALARRDSLAYGYPPCDLVGHL